MDKYKDEKDFIKKEFMKGLTDYPDIFKLEEDDDNYYIASYLKGERYELVTLYKNKIKEIMEIYEKEGIDEENYKFTIDLGEMVSINQDTGEIIKED